MEEQIAGAVGNDSLSTNCEKVWFDNKNSRGYGKLGFAKYNIQLWFSKIEITWPRKFY